jgi:hypothetical protein
MRPSRWLLTLTAQGSMSMPDHRRLGSMPMRHHAANKALAFHPLESGIRKARSGG